MGPVSSADTGEPADWNLDLAVRDWLDWTFGEGVRNKMSLDPRKQDLERRLESVGWGLVFLLFGALAMPNGPTQYAVVVAIGGALIGLNVVRVALGIEVAWFGLILGASMLIGATGALVGMHMDVFVVFFALAGAVTIAGALVRPIRRVDPKAAGGA